MSLAARNALATAASSVAGVKATPYYRQSGKVGDAFVRLDRVARDSSGFGYMATWQVCVVLSQDQAHAERWIDDNLPALTTALEHQGVVTTAQPVQLALETGTVPALVITLAREQE